MSNKSRSRKQRAKDIQSIEKLADSLLKVSIAFHGVVNSIKSINDLMLSTKQLPKLATGGTVYGTSNELIRGGEMIVPVASKGGYMNDNDQYMFQND